MINTLTDPFSALEKHKNLKVEVKDAWAIFNQEDRSNWAKPGSFIQYHITGPNNIEIWVMRVLGSYTGSLEFWLDFGPDPQSKESLSLDRLMNHIQSYLLSKGISI